MVAFSLLKLPDFAADYVIKHMKLSEKVKLSMCSIRAGNSIRRTKVEIGQLEVHLGTFGSSVALKPILDDEKDMFSVIFVAESRKYYPAWGSDNRNDKEYRRVAQDSIASCVNLSHRLSSVFFVKFCSYSLNVASLDSRRIQEIIPFLLKEQHHHVTIHGKAQEKLSIDDLVLIMKSVKPSASLQILSSIPDDFRYETAFNFKSMFYSTASWVTLDNLLSIRNSELHLGSSALNSDDMNKFLHHWVNCEDDMMENFYIVLKKNEGKEVLDEDDIMKKLTYVFTNSRQYRFIKCKNNERRKFPLGRISIVETCGSFEFKTFEDTPGLYNQILTNLEAVDSIKELDEEMQENRELEKGQLKSLDEGSSEDGETVAYLIESLEERRKEIESEIEEIKTRLEGVNFRYTLP